MENVEQDLIEKLGSIGVYLKPRLPFITDERPNLIAVRVEIAIKDAQISAPKFNIETVSKRGVVLTVSDFAVLDDAVTGQGKKLTFLVSQQMPEGTKPPLERTKYIATAFVDLCYYQGNEAVDPNLIPPCETPVAPNAVKEDLGWYLPSRFLDALIDGLGKINEVFLLGMMDEGIIYGIVQKDGKE